MKRILCTVLGLLLATVLQGQEKWTYQNHEIDGKLFAFSASVYGNYESNGKSRKIEIIQFLRYVDNPQTFYFHLNDGFTSNPLLSQLTEKEFAQISFDGHKGQYSCDFKKIKNDNKEVLNLSGLKMTSASMPDEENEGISMTELFISDIMMSTKFYIYFPSVGVKIEFPSAGFAEAMGFLFGTLEQSKK